MSVFAFWCMSVWFMVASSLSFVTMSLFSPSFCVIWFDTIRFCFSVSLFACSNAWFAVLSSLYNLLTSAIFSLSCSGRLRPLGICQEEPEEGSSLESWDGIHLLRCHSSSGGRGRSTRRVLTCGARCPATPSSFRNSRWHAWTVSKLVSINYAPSPSHSPVGLWSLLSCWSRSLGRCGWYWKGRSPHMVFSQLER